MKSLNDYTEQKVSELLSSMGAFYAFSKAQLEDKRQEGVIYCHMGHGLIAPKGKAKALFEGLAGIHKKGIQ